MTGTYSSIRRSKLYDDLYDDVEEPYPYNRRKGYGSRRHSSSSSNSTQIYMFIVFFIVVLSFGLSPELVIKLSKKSIVTKSKEIEKKQDTEEKEESKPEEPKIWMPCESSDLILERHDFENRHGDMCRMKNNSYKCPVDCRDTGGNAPFCANKDGGPCRVKDPSEPKEFRCDLGGICILSVHTEQERKAAKYKDSTCDNKCGDARSGQLTEWKINGGRCRIDFDCSLAGVCTQDGTCLCDAWASGIDCSFLNFQKVDKSRLGYLHPHISSWGGSIVKSKRFNLYHMFTSEILCKDNPSRKERCGLNAWETHSRIAETVAENIDGPYQRIKTVFPPEHHNPSIHISPRTGDWHLFSISGSTGPIERTISTDEGDTWSSPIIISPRQNPGPLLQEDGSTLLFYRADGLPLPEPTCSDEGISIQYCPSETGRCDPPQDIPLFSHTGEDPSVFRDHRGNFHMLFNAHPFKCQPKLNQGAHAWSLDGIHWSNPRVGAFDTTIHFTDGSNMKCERRERPQMVLDDDGKPLALISAVTGCPQALGDKNGDGKNYRGADDCFTLIQKMGSAETSKYNTDNIIFVD